MPYIEEVRVTPSERDPGYFSIATIWSNYDVEPTIDRPDNFSILLPEKLVERYVAAVEAGVVFYDPTIVRDVNDHTFVSSPSAVMGRYANADLKRLGF